MNKKILPVLSMTNMFSCYLKHFMQKDNKLQKKGTIGIPSKLCLFSIAFKDLGWMMSLSSLKMLEKPKFSIWMVDPMNVSYIYKQGNKNKCCHIERGKNLYPNGRVLRI